MPEGWPSVVSGIETEGIGSAPGATLIVPPEFGEDLIVGRRAGPRYDGLDLRALSNPICLRFVGPGMGTVTDQVTGDSLVFSGVSRIDLGPAVEVVGTNLDGGSTIQRRPSAGPARIALVPSVARASGCPAPVRGGTGRDTGPSPESLICFTPSTAIATNRGARPVQDLVPGDLIVTRDRGLQPLRWIGRREVLASGPLAPIRIRRGVLTDLERDLVVSPRHRLLFHGYRAELLFGESEVLVAAGDLVDGVDVTREPDGSVTYLHLLFDEHEIVYAEGAATESFHPCDNSLGGIDPAAREALFGLFPDLRTGPGPLGRTARRCLDTGEARLIADRN